MFSQRFLMASLGAATSSLIADLLVPWMAGVVQNPSRRDATVRHVRRADGEPTG